MSWQEEFEAIAKRARKPETIEEAARDAFALARRQPIVEDRIRIKQAWHAMRRPANWNTAPPYEGMLDDLDQAARIEGLLAAMAAEPKVAGGATTLLSLYARPEDADRVLVAALEGSKHRDQTRAGGARYLLQRMGDVAPERAEPILVDLLKTTKPTEVDLGVMMLRTRAARSRLDEHLDRVVAIMVKEVPRRRIAILRNVAGTLDPALGLDLARRLLARLDVQGAIDDETMREARGLVVEFEERLERARRDAQA